MNQKNKKPPACFGDLETVFPEGKDGLRISPESCMECHYKTDCLRTAMQGRAGIPVREAAVDRAYESGTISFIERWSRKKEFHRHRQKDKKKGD